MCVARLSAQITDQAIDRWVSTAKAGRATEALAALRELVAANPTSVRAAQDRVVVATWAEAYEEALAGSAQLRGVIPA